MTALNIHGKESCSLTQSNGIFQKKGFEIWSLLLINILIGLIMPDSLQAQCNPSGNVSRYEIDITPNGPLNIVGQQFCTSQSMGTNCCGNQNIYRCLDIIFNVKNGPMGEMFSDDCSGMANFMTAQGNFDALFFNVGVPDPAGGATNCSAAIQIKNNYTIEVTFTGNNAGQLVLDMRVLDNMGNIVSNQSQVVAPGQSAIFTICKPGFGCVEDEIVFGCCEISSSMVLATNAPSTICTGESTTLKVTGLNGTPPYTATIRETSAMDTSYFDVIINDDMDGNASMDMTTVNVTPLVNTTYKLISIEDATGCAEPGNSQSVSITVLPLPEVDAVMDMTYCDGDMVPSVLFTSNVPGATFSWSRTNENIGLPSTNGTGNVPSFTASNSGNFPITATFSVVATITQNGVSCTGSPKQFTITVNPVPEVNPVQNMTYCSGAVVPAIALSSNVLGATLAWSHTNTAIGLALQNGMGNIPSFTANNTTNSPISSVFSVQATYENNGVMCPGPVIQFTITINPLPRVNPVANQEHCPGIQVPATVFSSNIPGTTFTWTRTVPTPDIGLMPVSGNGNVPSYISNNPSNHAIVSTFTVTPVFTNNNVSCEGPTLDYTVTILNAPQAMANPGMQTICSGNPITTILLSSNMQGATYSWTRDNVAIVTGIPAAGSGNISGTLVNTTNAPVTVTFTITPTANGCQGNVITATVLVNPTPAAFVVTGGGLVCNTDQVGVPVGLSGSQLNVNYQLLLNGNPAGVPLAGTGGALNFGSPVAPGTYTVVATHAQGACSRTMTGSAIITVFNCSAQIVNACVCLNNGTNLTNSQFGESIKVNAPSNQNWTILSSAGFYSAGSPAPPSAPVSLPNGTPLQNIGGNMFSLDGRHVDAVGYSLSLSNGLGTVFNLSNTCQYPDPVITTDLNGPFCLYSDPVNLAGQPGDANIISQGFTVNGIPATQFDPSQGIGQYIISYTVNGGTPKAFGANDPGCIQTVTQIVNVVATPSNLVCNDLVFVALGDDCIEVINPDMILEGSYLCFDDYIVELDCTPPLGNGPWLPAVVDADDIGDMCVARVTHLPSGNTCSGMIKVQDNTPPVIICKPITVPCNVPDVSPLFFQNILNIDDAYPSVMDCQGFTLTWTDSEIPQNCASGLTKIINRTWTAKDASGNTATCVQVISFLRPNFQNIDLPPNYDDITLPGFDCLDPYPTPEWIEDQGLQGFPYFMGFPIGCNVNASFTDLVVPVCEGTYTIFRQWTIIDACTGMILNHIQTIRVTDEEGPEFTCPDNMVVSVNPFDCCANADLPDIIIRDHCSGILNLSGFIETFDPFTGDPINTIPIQGTLQNFPGNNLWDSDTLGVFGFTTCLPVGVQKVTYIAQDDCGNTHSCQFDLEVKDLAPPVAACDEFTTVALGSNGMALVNASTFDDGSYDNCCLGNFEVARAEVNDCTDTLFSDTVKFCCSDIGNTVMVTFRVFDCNGNSNDCMVLVEVQDRIKPTCLPPAQANVNCENFDPSLWSYGIPNVSDNCCLDSSQVFMGQFGLTHSVNYALFDTVCNKGTITRTFKTYDCYGNSSQCTQRILVYYK
ncbi:MAG TPA: hypothetical protein DCF33_22410, partial [Saprospirales bacterium]|nr:hypothetical protein [Saprospirales bacterium]